MRERLSAEELERQHQLFEHRLELSARDPHLRMVLEVADVRRVWLALEELREWRSGQMQREQIARESAQADWMEEQVKKWIGDNEDE